MVITYVLALFFDIVYCIATFVVKHLIATVVIRRQYNLLRFMTNMLKSSLLSVK